MVDNPRFLTPKDIGLDLDGPFTPTSPNCMEDVLREAVLESNDQNEANITLPYTGQLYDVPTFMNIRRRTGYEGDDKFSIDVGVLSHDGKILFSAGFADFKIAPRKGRKPPIGYMHMGEQVYVEKKPFRISRAYQMIKDFEAIHVLPELRGRGVGKSLVSASRVILDELGVRVLMIDEIKTDQVHNGQFYKNLGGRRFVSGRKSKAMCMPVYPTSRLPYVFDLRPSVG